MAELPVGQRYERILGEVERASGTPMTLDDAVEYAPSPVG
jgi:hypothetical protein